MSNHLLFQAYTKQQVAQCRYFLLKYLALYNLKPPAGTAAVVYTNDPVSFEGFTSFFPDFRMPDTAVAIGMVSPTAALHHFLQHYSGAVLYCHPATYPLQPLEHVFSDIEKGALYLHSPRQYTETEITKALRRTASPRDKTTTAVAPPQTRVNVWHAAVIGLHHRHKALVDQLLQGPTDPGNALSFDYSYSSVFQESGKIKSAAKYIFEYSRLPEFGPLLEGFFKKNEEESIPNQIKLLHHIDAAAIQQQKDAYQKQPLFKKWLQVITGKRWSIQQYTKKF